MSYHNEVGFALFVRLLARLIHITCSLFTFTVCILECFFNFKQFGVVQDNPFFKTVANGCGLGMIFSGIALTSLMRKQHANLAQNEWLAYFPPKFFLSLLMTPFCDKIAQVVLSSGPNVPLSEQWQTTFLMFRLALIVIIYLYSAIVRRFREESNNFEDNKNFSNVLDGMIKKLR